ncbi:cytochrome P450 9e2-like [Hyposmocoma kahamanoa]|uniref:cytochrome P450 9e2-like n=1 Tax=Hyposmocoma kahamanoa TaxID=1477025 RepID=UPI000E6D8661|nr:cytochrome P450 9e2-like [Hyposmocoma kahamanoa]
MLVWIWLGCLVAAVLLYFRQVYSFFKRRGVKTPGIIPPFGTMLSVLVKREHFAEQITRFYNQFPDQKFYGTFQFTKPFLQVRDIELIKKICIKEFESFLDHNTVISEDYDPLFGRNLFSLKGQEWKDMRSTLSPAFTSSKMKMMLPLMVEVGDQMNLCLQKKIKESKHGYLDVDVKDLTTRYTNDVIASCAFGLKVDSHMKEGNQFYKMGKTVAYFKFRQILMFFLLSSFPKVAGVFKWTLFPKSVQNFFRALVVNTMKNRELEQIIRPDMIHLLMEAKKGKLTYDEKSSRDKDAGFATVEESFVGQKQINRVWSDDDLCAQVILFFIAGFEGVSSAMTFLLYELSVNPDVQEKLYQEIRENEAKNNGKFDYNSIQNMVYMDMVVSETLRLWTSGFATDRYCNKDYNLGKPNDEATEDYIMRKGESLQIPVCAIHRDPEYYPNPHKFDPERFSEENKHKIQPFTYLPFGIGPRNCIGSRFALCEVKVMAYQVVNCFEVFPSERTTIPPKLDPSTFNVHMKGGHWNRFKARKEVQSRAHQG